MSHHIASQYFGEFPSLQRHIEESAQNVAKAEEEMMEALRNLQKGGDKKSGWNRLFDKLKAIPSKTVILLQCVYRGEVISAF